MVPRFPADSHRVSTTRTVFGCVACDSLITLIVYACWKLPQIAFSFMLAWVKWNNLALAVHTASKQGLLQIWSMRNSEWTCRIYEGLAGISHARWADSEMVLVTVDFQFRDLERGSDEAT